MFLKKKEYVNSFFKVKECKITLDEESSKETVELTVTSDIGKNTHTVIAPLTPHIEEVCVLGSLVQVIGIVDDERRIYAEQILPAFATLPSTLIDVNTELPVEEIIAILKSMINDFDYCPLGEVLYPILKFYEDDLISLTKPCKLRGIDCPTELHAAFALVSKFQEMAIKHTHLNDEVLFALTLLRILKPLRENLITFLSELDYLLPVHTAVFDAVMLREYALSDDFKI